MPGEAGTGRWRASLFGMNVLATFDYGKAKGKPFIGPPIITSSAVQRSPGPKKMGPWTCRIGEWGDRECHLGTGQGQDFYNRLNKLERKMQAPKKSMINS